MLSWNTYSSFQHISHFKGISIWYWYGSQTLNVVDYSVRYIQVMGDGIFKSSFQPETQLYPSFVRLTCHTWPLFQVVSLPGHWISQSVTFEKISAAHLTIAFGLSLGWSSVPNKVLKILTKHSIALLSPYRNLDITGPNLKWHCPDRFQRQY